LHQRQLNTLLVVHPSHTDSNDSPHHYWRESDVGAATSASPFTTVATTYTAAVTTATDTTALAAPAATTTTTTAAAAAAAAGSQICLQLVAEHLMDECEGRAIMPEEVLTTPKWALATKVLLKLQAVS
jgi:hypothetical protein